MCQLQPERTHMAMYERPEPTTLRPTSRSNFKNINCCSHCQSGIDKSDKVCSRCGAPNENYKQEVKESMSWGELIRQIENTEPSSLYDSKGKECLIEECLLSDSKGDAYLSHKYSNSYSIPTIIDDVEEGTMLTSWLPENNGYAKISINKCNHKFKALYLGID